MNVDAVIDAILSPALPLGDASDSRGEMTFS